MKGFGLIALVGTLLACPAQAAGFDCGKAGSPVEKTICGNEELSELDEILTRTYRTVLDGATDPQAVSAQQRHWLGAVRNRCKDADCLTREYEERISVLEAEWEKRYAALERASANAGRSPAKPFEGDWRRCELWKGDEVCSSYQLLQEGRNVCGEWEYWATNRTYSGQLQAAATSASEAQLKLICGTPGSATSTDCQSEEVSGGGWEKTAARLALCSGRLHEPESGKTCAALAQSRGFAWRPLPKEDRQKLLSQPWLKSCLSKGAG